MTSAMHGAIRYGHTEEIDRFCDIIVEHEKKFDFNDNYDDDDYEHSNKHLYGTFMDLLYQNISKDYLFDVLNYFDRIYQAFSDKKIALDIFENLIDFIRYNDNGYKYSKQIVDYILSAHNYFKDEKLFYSILRKTHLKEPSRDHQLPYSSIDELKYMLNLELKFNESTKEKDFKDVIEYIINRQIFINNQKEKINFFDRQNINKNNIFTVKEDLHLISKIGYNMTLVKHITNPAIARDAEIKMLEVVITSPKKSPILVGEAGVGKTAIVEGLAYLLQQGNVPEILKNKEIYSVSLSNLIAGAHYVGDTEQRASELIKELKEHKEIISFMDEIHTIVGAGTGEKSNNDIANILKPYLDRGEIKIIGATTNYEYEKYIMKDKALSRRFYPIFVEEPDKETTKRILIGSIPSIEKSTNVKYNFSDSDTELLINHIIDTSILENQVPNFITQRPEMPLTILEMAFAYAALESSKELRVEDLYNSIYNEYKLKQEVREESAKMLKKKL